MNFEMIIEVTDLNEKLTKDFVEFCCKELEIEPDSITIDAYDETIKHPALGLCWQVEDHKYIIEVATKNRTLTEIYNTVAHELIHVKQFEVDDLEKYFVSINKPTYKERWWEIEAEKNSFDLVKKYVDILQELV